MRFFRTTFCAAAAAAAVTSMAFAAPAFQSESLGTNIAPLYLFNNGQVLIPGPVEYGANNCPIVQRPDQTGCVPPLVSRKLALLTAPGQVWTVLPYNVLNSSYRFNHDGKGVIWSSDPTSLPQAVDVFAGTSAPFAQGVASPLASCSSGYWSAFTDTGKVIEESNACAQPNSI
jgi:hypothetical protein